MINVEVKVIAIYYEDSIGKFKKFYHESSKRLTMDDAYKILHENNVNVTTIVRVITERLYLQVERDKLENMVVKSEKYFKN